MATRKIYLASKDDLELTKTNLNQAIMSVDSRLSAETSRAQGEERRLEHLFTNAVDEEVDRWLNSHPEAVTKIPDHSLTFEKFDKDGVPFATPAMFYQKTDPDDTASIQRMFDEVRTGVIVFEKNKVYEVSSPITIHAGRTTLTVFLGAFKFKGTYTSEAVINIESDTKSSNPPQDIYGGGQVKLYGGHIDCNKVSGCGIRIPEAYYCVLDGIVISNFKEYGVDISPTSEKVATIMAKVETGTMTSLDALLELYKSTQIMISNCYFNNYSFSKKAADKSSNEDDESRDVGTAFRISHTDNNICNCVTNRTKVAMEFGLGGNFISNCHFTVGRYKPEKQEDIENTFIKINVPSIATDQIQYNSFNNCYFNGHRMKYLIECTKEHTSLVTDINNCSLILGTCDTPLNCFIENSTNSANSINGLTIRKNKNMTIYGVRHNNASKEYLERSTMNNIRGNERNQNTFDINNLSSTPFYVITNNIPLEPYTLRRVATVCESSLMGAVATLDFLYDKRALVELKTSINSNIGYQVRAGKGFPVKIYKDRKSHVTTLENGYDVRSYDIYIYNDSEDPITQYMILKVVNDDFPFGQVFTYFGAEEDIPNINPTTFKEPDATETKYQQIEINN